MQSLNLRLLKSQNNGLFCVVVSVCAVITNNNKLHYVYSGVLGVDRNRLHCDYVPQCQQYVQDVHVFLVH